MSCRAFFLLPWKLRGGALGIGLDIEWPPRAGHFDVKLHQIAFQKARFHTVIDRRALGHIRPGRAAARQDRQEGKQARHAHHSAASFGSLRARACADSSAISVLARAIGFVR